MSNSLRGSSSSVLFHPSQRVSKASWYAAHLERDGTRIIDGVEDFELESRRGQILCARTTRNTPLYLERLEPGVDTDNVRFLLVSRASGSSQPGQTPLKISTNFISSLGLRALTRHTVLATPDV